MELSSLIFSLILIKSIHGISDDLIINGEVAYKGQFPYQVALKLIDVDDYLCGGAVISVDWILTAGHCLIEHKEEQLKILLGSTQVDGEDENRVERTAEKIIIHEEFLKNDKAYDYDVGLIQVKVSLPLGDRIQAIRLNKAHLPPGQLVTVSGWGFTRDTFSLSQVLRYVTLKTISKEDCQKKYQIALVNRMLCALSPDATLKATCHGDSGGPLVISMPNGPVHVGVVSFGGPNCESGYPNAFARTDLHRAWIRETTGV